MSDKIKLDEATRNQIKRFMLAAGLKQHALATAMKTTQPKVSEMLTGKQAIGMHMLRALARALGRPVYELLGLPPPVDLPPDVLSTIAGHFRRLNVPRDDAFEKAGFFADNPDQRCIGTILSVNNLRGAVGVPPEMIALQPTSAGLQFPRYINDEIARTKVLSRDGNKVALTKWEQLPTDADGGKIHVEVAATKYSTKMAMRAVRGRLIDDIVARRVLVLDGEPSDTEWPVARLPCHLHCDGLVLTGDSKVILAQRGSSVDMQPMQWAASFGEGMEWDADRDAMGVLHPHNTIVRGLDEELGLSQNWLTTRFGNAAKVTFLNLIFDIANLVYALFSIIELPNLGIEEALDRARNYRTDKEARAFDSMDFTPQECVPAIINGSSDGKRLNDAARFALLLASINKFGSVFVQELARR